jgi:hypothetical protein
MTKKWKAVPAPVRLDLTYGEANLLASACEYVLVQWQATASPSRLRVLCRLADTLRVGGVKKT